MLLMGRQVTASCVDRHTNIYRKLGEMTWKIWQKKSRFKIIIGAARIKREL